MTPVAEKGRTIYENEVLSSLARAIAIAEEVAHQKGYNFNNKRLKIEQNWVEDDLIWEVAFVPMNIFRIRGGVITIFVRASDGVVIKTLRGQ